MARNGCSIAIKLPTPRRHCHYHSQSKRRHRRRGPHTVPYQALEGLLTPLKLDPSVLKDPPRPLHDSAALAPPQPSQQRSPLKRSPLSAAQSPPPLPRHASPLVRAMDLSASALPSLPPNEEEKTETARRSHTPQASPPLPLQSLPSPGTAPCWRAAAASAHPSPLPLQRQ